MKTAGALFCALTIVGALQHSAIAEMPDISYQFDDLNNNVASDAAGNRYDARLTTAALITDEQPRFGAGSLKLQGTGGKELHGRGWYVVSGKNFPLGFGEEITKMTVMCWVRPGDNKSRIVFFWRHQEQPENTVVFGWMDRFLTFSITAEGKTASVKSPQDIAIYADEWIHFAATYDRGEVRLYIDAALVAKGRVPDFPIIPYSGENTCFAGLMGARLGTFMDDFALFGDRALNQEEIAKICTGGLATFPR